MARHILGSPRLKLLLAAVLTLAGATFATSGASAATYFGNPTCPQPWGASSTACLYGSVVYNTFADIPNSNMWEASSLVPLGDGVSQMEIAFSGAPCTDWAQQGFAYGLMGNADFEYFYAWSNSSGTMLESTNGLSTDNGSLNGYSLQYVGNYEYDFALNGTVYTYASDMGAGTCNNEAGLWETPDQSNGAAIDGNMWAGTAELTNLDWMNTSYQWQYGWNLNDSMVQWPCGDGNSHPDCLNGTYYGSQDWADNHLNASGN